MMTMMIMMMNIISYYYYLLLMLMIIIQYQTSSVMLKLIYSGNHILTLLFDSLDGTFSGDCSDVYYLSHAGDF